MKTMAKIMLAALCCGSVAMAAGSIAAPENPATGIWIQQVGDIVPHASTKATLYYTKFGGPGDRIKDLNYYYDGAGYLQLLNKDTLCTMSDGLAGADGIVHHPDGDLLVAGQGTSVHKISKTAKKSGGRCLVKTAKPATSTDGFWHLMMDPNAKWLWAAGIPGYLYRFSTKTDPTTKNLADKGYRVELVPNGKDRVKNKKLATLIWDNDGNAFFTYSDYTGGGCETDIKGKSCTADMRKRYKAGAYFGYITDTTKTVVTKENVGTVGGEIGDTVITKLGTKILIDSLEGAHGGTFDTYSGTIFVFGGARIVQIKPYVEGGQMKAKVVAYIDLRDYFFDESEENLTQPRTPSQNDGNTSSWSGNNMTPSLGWRLDQGTVDGMGHLFVASNTGHLVFVDYAANPNKYINDNVLVHLQWIDNYLDDLAPLSGVGVVRTGANTGSETEISSSSIGFSSSRIEYSESSSSAKSSSSVKSSSSSTPGSSGSDDSSSSGTGSSGSGEPGSSGSDDSSSSGTGSSSSGEPGSSGSDDSSSSGKVNSSGSNPGSSGSDDSSSSGKVNSSGSNPNSSGSNPGSSGSGDSSSSGKGGSSSSSKGGSGSKSSSSMQGGGEDLDLSSSSSKVYVGFEDYDLSSGGSGIDFYPSDDKFEKGDSVISQVVVLLPVDSAGGESFVKIGMNYYKEKDNPELLELDLRVNSKLDSAQVGQVVAMTLDSAKVAKYFGTDLDSLTFATTSGLTLIDPTNPESLGDTIRVNADGSVTIWVTADSVVKGGSIIVHDPVLNTTVIIDNINFYDPIPDAQLGYIKDGDGDKSLDYVEIVLKDSVHANLEVSSVVLVVNGDTLKTKHKPGLNGSRDRISLDVGDLKFPDKFPDDAIAVITYTDKYNGTAYERESRIVEVGSQVIESAVAIRDEHGKDSLFVLFNVDLVPKDLSAPEQLLLLKQESKRYGFELDQITNVYMPTRNMIILVGESMGLKGDMRDSVSLHPSAQFSNLEYLTSDEFDREIPVSVVDRLPSVKDAEYWDTDGDGAMDQIVMNFSSPLSEKELSMVYATFPWYSERGLLVQLQAQPADLKFDGKDSTRVVWNVHSTTPLAKGVTSISESLPPATIYDYYDVLGQTFVSEESAPLVDKMSPVISAVTLSYGSKADTLIVYFSEVIKYGDLKGDDFFSYIHGRDTIDIVPKNIDWASDGTSAKLVIDAGASTILPGDSLMVVKGSKDVIQDNFGNVAGEDPSPVVIAGLLNHLVEATKMGHFDDENSVLQTLSSVNLRYVPGSTTKEDVEKEGALGQLVQLGERFVPQLLDRAQISADGSVDPSVLDSLDPEKVFITFVVNYYDHLGQYVNDTTILVPCNSPKFGGNCLVSDQKVFVNWNFKDHNGRFVGTGIYMVQFKMVVRYEKKKIEEEIKDKWGVRRKRQK